MGQFKGLLLDVGPGHKPIICLSQKLRTLSVVGSGTPCMYYMALHPGQVVDQSHLADTRGPTRFSSPPLEAGLGNNKVSLCGH